MMIAGSLLMLVAGLSLELTSPQQAVLIGEPVKVVVRWKATSDVPPILIEDPEFGARTLSFQIDNGKGPIVYKERPRTLADPVVEPSPLAKGQEVVVNYALLGGRHEGAAAMTPIFAVPGEYRVKAVYAGPGTVQPVESNPLTFTARAPSGDEEAVWAMLTKEPHLRHGDGKLERLHEVVSAHPQSRYLAWAKVVLYRRRANELHNRYDPDTGESFWQLDRSALPSALAPRYRRMATTILAEDWGAFEEERLFQALSYASAAGESQIAHQAKNQLLADFPRSMSAGEVRDHEAALAEAAIEDRETDDTQPPPNDTTPPVLVIGASPSSLWPPNHKLVPVTVAISVSDNIDTSPTVKLVSITCDDGCDPSVDVSGAALNTDDRQFQLRAERLGTGSGRTYTVTYSATDASGNSTTKATAVTVPHDQRANDKGTKR